MLVPNNCVQLDDEGNYWICVPSDDLSPPEGLDMAGATVTLRPSSLYPIEVTVRESWGPDAPEGCWTAEAIHVGEASVSPPVSIGSTPGCVIVPEAPLVVSLIVGVLVAVAMARLRSACSNSNGSSQSTNL